MSAIKRWHATPGDGPGVYWDEEPDGKWVRYEDAKATIDALKKVLAEACDECDSLTDEEYVGLDPKIDAWRAMAEPNWAAPEIPWKRW